MQALSTGIYNAFNSTNKRHLSIKQFVDGVNSSNEWIEANLVTVLNLSKVPVLLVPQEE